jgi:D-aminoacyl-tRNA deacylase
MRAVIQRVTHAAVRVDNRETGAIGSGLLVFLAVHRDDTPADAAWIITKIPRLRCFEDESGRMNRSLLDTGGGILLISQFTLFGSLKKGTRPSFNRAALPDLAIPLYESVKLGLETAIGRPVASGEFGAKMDITALNDGPVTLIIDSANTMID